MRLNVHALLGDIIPVSKGHECLPSTQPGGADPPGAGFLCFHFATELPQATKLRAAETPLQLVSEI